MPRATWRCFSHLGVAAHAEALAAAAAVVAAAGLAVAAVELLSMGLSCPYTQS